jgi:hypothetical protein
VSGQSFFGKYRGIVWNNVDPYLQGRVQVQVPGVAATPLLNWAQPCFPVAGMGMGFFAVPVIGSGVWVEFEQGDPDHPIWVGCITGSTADVPSLALTAPAPTPAFTIQTPLKNGMVISDGLGPMGTGGIVLQSTTGAMIVVNDLGIIISNGKGAQITLIGPTVDINTGALTVI